MFYFIFKKKTLIVYNQDFEELASFNIMKSFSFSFEICESLRNFLCTHTINWTKSFWSYDFLEIYEEKTNHDKILELWKNLGQEFVSSCQYEESKNLFKLQFLSPFEILWRKSVFFKDFKIEDLSSSLYFYLDDILLLALKKEAFKSPNFLNLHNWKPFLLESLELSQAKKEKRLFEYSFQKHFYPKYLFTMQKKKPLIDESTLQKFVFNLALLLNQIYLFFPFETLLCFGNLIYQNKYVIEKVLLLMKTLNPSLEKIKVIFSENNNL